jgi:hypothetical protein
MGSGHDPGKTTSREVDSQVGTEVSIALLEAVRKENNIFLNKPAEGAFQVIRAREGK